jgi:hypothetical protein
MLDWLRYRYQLARLHRQKKRIQRGWAKVRAKAKAENKDREELHGIASDEWLETDTVDEDIRLLETRYLTAVAEKYFLPIPEREESDATLRYMFTKETINQLRSAIRAEQKERSELARSWLSSITGLVGALIGLLAIILRKR